MPTATVAFSKRSAHKLEFTIADPVITATTYTYTYSARMVTTGNTLRPFASNLPWASSVAGIRAEDSGTYSYDFRSPAALNTTFGITNSQTFVLTRPLSTAADVNYTLRFIANSTNASTELIGIATAEHSVVIAKRVPVTPAPVWSTTSFAGTARVGTAVSDSFTAADTTSYALSSGSLPPGLTLNTSSGTISGTVTAGVSQSYSFVLRATGTGGATNSSSFTYARKQPLPAWTDNTLASNTLRVGTAYSDGVLANNSPTYSSVGLPANGLSLNTSTGAVTGTPDNTGQFSFNISALNTDGDGVSQNFTLTPLDRLATWVDNTLSTTTVKKGQAYSDAVFANNASSYAVQSGSLPAGISLDTTFGDITGTPTTVGTSTFTLRATNSSNESIFTGSLTITVQTAGSGYVWNGSIWSQAPFKVWNGSSWVESPVKVWNGSIWTDPIG